MEQLLYHTPQVAECGSAVDLRFTAYHGVEKDRTFLQSGSRQERIRRD